jgi:hypothetical protein
MKIGESYKIVIDVDSRVLTYTATIISDDGIFITFKDKFGKTFSYNRKNIISFEEVG